MEDSTIIWKYLTREFPDNHQAIYLYICGRERSKVTSMDQIMKSTEKIFCPPLDVIFVKKVISEFLKYKNKQYIKGEIKLKPLYS